MTSRSSEVIPRDVKPVAVVVDMSVSPGCYRRPGVRVRGRPVRVDFLSLCRREFRSPDHLTCGTLSRQRDASLNPKVESDFPVASRNFDKYQESTRSAAKLMC